MTNERFDLIVVGCGPAGASCAGRAAELGLSVVVLEMAGFPRSKPCGAGLTQAALGLLGDDADLVTHDAANRLRMEVGRTTVTWTGEAPLVRTTTRRELDALLARRAEEAGAVIEFGALARGVRQESDGVDVTAGARTVRGRFLVGADGPRSSVALAMGCARPRLRGEAYVRAFPPSQSELARHTGTVTFDPTATLRGYGWVFPKRDHLNVGVYSQRPFGKWILDDLWSFIGSRGLRSWEKKGPYAAPIPADVRLRELARGRIMLVGDAAGLVDPISGEGIPHAIASGRMAAEAIASSLSGTAAASSLGGVAAASTLYSSRVRSEIVPAMMALRSVGNVMYSLGPRGIERAAAVPFARFIIRRLGRGERPGGHGESLVVESTQGHRHQ